MTAIAACRRVGVAGDFVMFAIRFHRIVLVAIDAREQGAIGRLVVAVEAPQAAVIPAIDRELMLPVASAPTGRAVALLTRLAQTE